MRVDHRISLGSSATVQAELAALGVEVEAEGFIAFVVPESDPRWPAVAAWVAQEKPVDLVTTHFTKAEIAKAAWVELVPNWFHGYPEPDSDDFGYRHTTYDDSAFCPECGVGLRQVAPFRMAKEPKWGTRSLLQLHWVYDEFFAEPQLLADVFEGFGVQGREVLGPRAARLDTVLQLVVPEVAAVDTEGLAFDDCPRCHTRKYVHPVDDASPRLVAPPAGVHMLRSDAWFGTGGEAHHLVYVSQDLTRALQTAGARGAGFRPATRA